MLNALKFWKEVQKVGCGRNLRTEKPVDLGVHGKKNKEHWSTGQKKDHAAHIFLSISSYCPTF